MALNGLPGRTADRTADVVIIGDGVIGLSTALELARAGARCSVIGARRPGIASLAAAGLLAPSIGHLSDRVRPFFFGSLELYPAFVERLRAFDPSLAIVPGLLDVSAPDPDRPRDIPPRLTGPEVGALEPWVVAPHGAAYHPSNGAIDNVALVRALRAALAAEREIELVDDDPAVSVSFTEADPRVALESGARLSGKIIVLAAGAWSTQLAGLPRPVPVSPLKGQMLALRSTALAHSVMGPDVYLVPRSTELVVGATEEPSRFDVDTDHETLETLRAAAIDIAPTLAEAPVVRSWAGIRPATPDKLPIIGFEPTEPRLVYACGHSKNGILLAPATAVAAAALAQNRRSELDVTPFSISRFSTR
ncbi:MAG TPA: FAD-dependent oxidoreductase [Gemmatimonadaceae bacterium]|jgi:glycine oxidase